MIRILSRLSSRLVILFERLFVKVLGRIRSPSRQSVNVATRVPNVRKPLQARMWLADRILMVYAAGKKGASITHLHASLNVLGELGSHATNDH